MSCRRSLTQHCGGVLWDVLDLHARHSAIMALRAPFRNRTTRIPPVPGRRTTTGDQRLPPAAELTVFARRSPGQQPERQRALMLDDSVIIAAADIEQSRFRSLRAARRMSPHDAPHASKCDAQSIPTI